MDKQTGLVKKLTVQVSKLCACRDKAGFSDWLMVSTLEGAYKNAYVARLKRQVVFQLQLTCIRFVVVPLRAELRDK